MSRILDFIKYGKQIGKTHSDGSVLRKGNSFFGMKNVRTLLDKDGVVQKFIYKHYKNKDTFEVVHATPIKGDYCERYNVVKTVYYNDSKYPHIHEYKFIGKFSDGSDGTNMGWFLFPSSHISAKNYLLKSRK